MIGAEPPQLVHREATLGVVALELKKLSLEPDSPYGVPLRGMSLALRAGEVLGVAGVSGNGQQELLAALSGEDRALRAGQPRAVRQRHCPRQPVASDDSRACTSCPRSDWVAARYRCSRWPRTRC